MPLSHPAFKLVRNQAVESLNITIEEYEHIETGAQHIHLAANNPENVFLVALRTVPQDSTGVAHILEHTALCGSQRYPVRDPFFMMTRRSLNTFMNAFTSSDWTAYPFASVNRKDFNNLLDVYLDAVFFSRLDPLDFAQEGHRLEFSQPDNAHSDLEYKGVVFNEMKGAMSSVNSQLWQTLTKYLFPTNTYHHNSGGEPSCIPDLTYDELVAFYKTHYHPSNAIFMTYGDIPAVELQNKIQDQALAQFKRLDTHIHVSNEKRYFAPVKIEEHYPLNEEDLSHKTHLVNGWLLGDSTNLEEVLSAHLLNSVLIDNSASPLMLALETTELGQAPSPLCGLDDSQKELIFVCGIAGSEREHADALEQLVLGTLKQVAAEGVPIEDVEAALHQLELQQREVGGDSYPYGLQLILNALTAATHRGDPVAQLNVDAALEALRVKIQDPNFIPDLINRWLLNNPHRVSLTLTPDAELNERKDQAEKDQLANIKAALSDEQTQHIIQQARQLKERQAQIDDDSVLPKVTLDDVAPQEIIIPSTFNQTLPNSQQPLMGYGAGTNGLVYQQLVCELPALDDELLPLLPLYCALLTEVGIGQHSYLDVQRWQARVCGSISAYSSIRGSVDDTHKLNSFITLSGKALSSQHAQLCELMRATFTDARFDEQGRLRELIAQMRTGREQSITGSGHGLAMQGAAMGISPSAQLSFNLTGLEGIRKIKALDDSLSTPANLNDLQRRLTAIHHAISQAPKRFLLVGEHQPLKQYSKTFAEYFDAAKNTASESTFLPFTSHFEAQHTQSAWLTNSQVSFCAKAYPTVASDHPDAAALVILGNVMRNGYLHRTIREQGGAYGGGAGQDNNSGAFRFYSYRDPRLGETLTDFDQAIEWAMSTDHSWQSVEEAILGVVSSLDKPDSPAGGAKREFHALINGRTPETRQRFRDRLLNVKGADLPRVAQAYLVNQQAHTCVITDKSKQADVEALQLKKFNL
ncbi:insulinase family protein [Marinagarivorans algicola]|uniref:insulinase family protein n=1 Tax=Marinagarivorans algicola TaxID=1513270 RepID=UPI0006B8C5A7|nr:insulinase family protein [Marinagarivorans algicola]